LVTQIDLFRRNLLAVLLVKTPCVDENNETVVSFDQFPIFVGEDTLLILCFIGKVTMLVNSHFPREITISCIVHE
jgi:hypothetical protein